MAGPLPPLQRVPQLERLLAPGESIIYTAKLHPLYGWWFGLIALVCLGLSYIWPWTLAGTLVFATLYLAPFLKNEIAVTTHRLLLRVGRFNLATEDFTGEQLTNWRINQSAVDNALHTGNVVIDVTVAGEDRRIVLTHLWHPVTFIQALETLQPTLRGAVVHDAA